MSNLLVSAWPAWPVAAGGSARRRSRHKRDRNEGRHETALAAYGLCSCQRADDWCFPSPVFDLAQPNLLPFGACPSTPPRVQFFSM